MEHLEQAAEVIKSGGVVAYPTESCFGLGCDPRNIEAVQRILALKKRPRDKGLIVIADRYERLTRYIAPLDDAQLARANATWPGPFTWVCPALPSTSLWLTGDFASLAVRVTAHPIAAELCRLSAMAIVSTSANIASQPALRNAGRVQEVFGAGVDFIVDGAIGRDPRPSTITDMLTGKIIR